MVANGHASLSLCLLSAPPPGSLCPQLIHIFIFVIVVPIIVVIICLLCAIHCHRNHHHHRPNPHFGHNSFFLCLITITHTSSLFQVCISFLQIPKYRKKQMVKVILHRNCLIKSKRLFLTEMTRQILVLLLPPMGKTHHLYSPLDGR